MSDIIPKPQEHIIKLYEYNPYPGHNADTSYRLIPALLPISLGLSKLTFYINMLIRYQYKVIKQRRLMPLLPKISSAANKIFGISFLCYIPFAIWRRIQNSSNTSGYNFYYAIDFTLYSLLSYVIFQTISAILVSKIPLAVGKITRSTVPLYTLSFVLSIPSFYFLFRAGDILADYILDSSYRKHFFDFKLKDPRFSPNWEFEEKLKLI